MINQQEWLRTRKNLLDQVKSQVQVRLGPMTSALRRYAKNLELEFRGNWLPSSDAQLRGALKKSRVVLSADFHAYSQSQRAHVRILRDQIEDRPVILGLECLTGDHDDVVQRFLSGRISESRFLQEVDWAKNWGFPWENYRPLFELAKDRGIQIRGLNSSRTENLQMRDRGMAQKIMYWQKEHPNSLIYAVVGEFHLAQKHLPGILRKRGLSGSELLLLFQDVEPLYFKLAKKKPEGSVDVLKGSGNRFCLMVSPPWMKWQSYLMYLEHAYDRDLQEDPAIDYTEHVTSLIQILEADLKVQIKKSVVQVFCPSSKTPLARLKASLPKKFSRILLYHLEHDLSFLIPERHWLYLSRTTINHASALAGQFVHAELCRRKRTLWDQPADFLPLVWTEAVGFFFSKWINPKRKSETLESIRLQLAARQPSDRGRQALLLALDHRLSEVVWIQTGRLRRSGYKPRDKFAYIEASRIIGSMMGERLFQKVRSGAITLAQLMSYLKFNIDQKEFTDFYWRVVREIEKEQSL